MNRRLLPAVLLLSPRSASAQLPSIGVQHDPTPAIAGQSEVVQLAFPPGLDNPFVLLFVANGAPPCADPLSCLGAFQLVHLGKTSQISYAAVPGMSGKSVSFFVGGIDAQLDVGISAIHTIAFPTLPIVVEIENGSWLEVDGAPFLPIYVWNQPPIASVLAHQKSLGVNTVMGNGWDATPSNNALLLDLLASQGMYAILDFDASVADRKNLLAWKIGDEPIDNGVPLSVVQQAQAAIKAADPIRPVVVNFSGGFYWDSQFGSPAQEALYFQFTAVPEVVSFDMYPVTGWNQPTWVYLPGAMTDFMRSHYVAHAKPVWAIVEASDQNLSWTPPQTPGPSAAQLRFEAFDSVIRGATALGYFTIAFNPFLWTNMSAEVEAEMAHTNGQLSALSAVILSPPPAATVAVQEASGKAVHLMLRRGSGGKFYLLADNADMGYGPADATFTFGQPLQSVVDYSTQQPLSFAGASFSALFGPLGVRIFEVEL